MKKNNIDIQYDKKDFILFKTTCMCGSPDHEMHVVVEKLHELDSKCLVTLFYKCNCNDYYNNGNFINRIFKRLRLCSTMLFKCYVEMEGDLIFRDREHLRDFYSALEEAARQVETCGDKAA